MRFINRRLILISACAGWMLSIIFGLTLLWGYENSPGQAAVPPSQWPRESRIHPASDRATLVMLTHPQCPCSRASVRELARLMAQAKGRVTAYALFVKPDGSPDDWEKTDLWKSAAGIPDVNVVVDDGAEAKRFRAETSGQTVLYDAAGNLLFSGGITGSRGHSGDNAGRSAIVALLNTGTADRGESSVFGCPLFASNSECRGTLDDSNKH